jgi:FkbM family methyltransferase
MFLPATVHTTMTRPPETEPSAGRKVKLGDAVVTVADDQPTFWDRVEAGRWESGTLAVMRARVDPSTVFIDLGAWVGPTALYAAALGARVIAVEADPVALDQLRRNLGANPALARRVDIVPRAVNATPEPVTLGARRKPGDSMSSTVLADAPVRWRAAAITPAELGAMVRDGERRFVKIDIEGGEYALLPRLGPLLDAPDSAVLVSFHPKILAAMRPQPSEQTAATAAALKPLAEFEAFAVTASGAAAAIPDAGAIAAREQPDAWLFVRRP